MFRGSIPDDVRRMVRQAVEGWTCRDVYVGCSGNFTVERVLADMGKFDLHGNDVTMYSSVLGWFFAGEDLKIAVAEPYLETHGWLGEYLAGPVEQVATVMLSTRLVESLNAKGEVKDNAHYSRLMAGYREQWPELHAKTVEKLSSLGLRLSSFYCGDVVEWVDTIPEDQGFVCYPPFYGGDYEGMFHKLDLLFQWPRPSYAELDQDRKMDFVRKTLRFEYWMLGLKEQLPELRPYLRGMAQTTNRGVPVWMYSSKAPHRIVIPRQDTEPVFAPRLGPGIVLGKTMKLSVLTGSQFHALRSQYMNPDIRPGQESQSVGVLVDGLLVGVFAFSIAPHPGSGADISRMYLLSDFPVAPSDYPRLAKLVLYAALSRESRLLAERLARRRIRTLYTTAFSERPISMKYRGIFELHKRIEQEIAKDGEGSGEHDKLPYQLNYIAQMGQWSLAEGLAIWKKKHGERVPE